MNAETAPIPTSFDEIFSKKKSEIASLTRIENENIEKEGNIVKTPPVPKSKNVIDLTTSKKSLKTKNKKPKQSSITNFFSKKI